MDKAGCEQCVLKGQLTGLVAMCCEGCKRVIEDAWVFYLEQLEKYKCMFTEMGKSKDRFGQKTSRLLSKCVKLKTPTRHPSGVSMDRVGYMIKTKNSGKNKKSKASC